MSWFSNAISGKFGEGSKSVAEVEADKAVKMVSEEAIKDEDGALCWKSNGSYLMDDMIEMLVYKDYDFSPEATSRKRKEQDAKFLEEYRSRPHVISDEELYEMRAAFGKGTTIVDVLTGEKIQL